MILDLTDHREIDWEATEHMHSFQDGFRFALRTGDDRWWEAEMEWFAKNRPPAMRYLDEFVLGNLTYETVND